MRSEQRQDRRNLGGGCLLLAPVSIVQVQMPLGPDASTILVCFMVYAEHPLP